MKTTRINIYGKVQGVWFRDFVRKTANKFELNGWTKNEPDGSVLVEVEGDNIIIDKFIEKLKIGSPLSKIQKVDVKWVENENKFQSFKIIR